MSGTDKMWPVSCPEEGRRRTEGCIVQEHISLSSGTEKRSGCGGDARELFSAPDAFLRDGERLRCSSLGGESEGVGGVDMCD